jgi:hypothetical protein
LPGIGWRGYDVARGIAVSNGHVAVAAGFDPDLAASMAGRYSGGAIADGGGIYYRFTYLPATILV